jgi:MFS family permease
MRPSPLPVAFAVFGMVWGAWQAVLPDLAAAYGLSTGPLGLILTAGFVASLPLMLVTGRLIERIGVGWGIALTAGVMGAGLLLVGTGTAVPLLVVAVVLFVSGSGSYDVAINGAAMGDTGWSRPARLTLLHAAFSGGGMMGALLGGALVGPLDAPYQLAYLIAVAGLLVAAVLARRGGGMHASRTDVDGVGRDSLLTLLLPLAVLAALAFLAEGSMETWSAIYLRDELGAAAFVGALGPGAFHAAMFVGRLIGAGVAGGLGARRTLLLAGGLTVIGMGVALLVPTPAVAIPGMAVAALGAAFVVPVVVSLAADRAGARAGRAASYVLTLGYAGFLVGPSLIGLLGEVAGLRLALAVVPVAAAIVAIASRTRMLR